MELLDNFQLEAAMIRELDPLLNKEAWQTARTRVYAPPSPSSTEKWLALLDT